MQCSAKKSGSDLTRYLAGIIKSSLPEGSVDMSKYMTKYGYEELCRDEDEEDTEGR